MSNATDTPIQSVSASTSFPEGFRIVHKRRFMAEGNTKYMLPSDDEELNRLDYQHYVIRHLIYGNFKAPLDSELEKGIRVIDVGCGSGIWVMEMAVDYPRSTFVGVDCAAVFPTKDIPPNCTFIRGNTLEGLPFKDESFDFVFQRLMILAFTPSDWRFATRELARITAPDGFVELIEGDFFVQSAPAAYAPLYNAIVGTAASRGIDLSVLHDLPSVLSDAGLVDVKADYVSSPLGWHGRVGDICNKSMKNLFVALKPSIRPVISKTDEEYDVMAEQIIDEMKEKKSWSKIPCAIGRKPRRG
ncbi:S-adenosyl-L-methionine-dependent methyltransferase [Jimgerdemannia flammicorona]|uniref:S-adenosyl-L-methionine-dependent methyltransferase n=1 Tax=Jimgerdemannia flammicorona TaxID=994334 RepID=A0A433CXN9_9FUNG|nr:S-adenosyl-L-methionine-dependent methyltransferase [Jimgerdemannia flammicorona]